MNIMYTFLSRLANNAPTLMLLGIFGVEYLGGVQRRVADPALVALQVQTAWAICMAAYFQISRIRIWPGLTIGLALTPCLALSVLTPEWNLFYSLSGLAMLYRLARWVNTDSREATCEMRAAWHGVAISGIFTLGVCFHHVAGR